LGDVLRVAEAEGTEPWQAIAAIRLLLFTGCRRTEIVSLKWEYIDYDNQAFLLPESKTGAKTVYVSAPVLEILENLPRQVGSPFVLPACRKEEGFYAGIGHAWADPTRKAGASIARRLRAHLGPSGNVIPFGGAPKRSKGAPAVHTVPAVRKARKALLGA
jgi:integrase